MKRTVYIETTVPSFFVETRQEPAAVVRRASPASGRGSYLRPPERAAGLRWWEEADDV